MAEVSRLTRQELYDLVWSEPVTTIASRYGISGRGFAKACERQQVPVPPRGYWARPEAARSRLKVNLPPYVAAPANPAPAPKRKVSDKPSPLDQALALIQKTREEQSLPPEPDPPTRDYSFHVTKWDWLYQVGMQGPGHSWKAPREEVYPEFEDIDMEGVLYKPAELAGRSISLSLMPTFGAGGVNFRESARAHVGAIEFFEASIAARAAMPESAASRLLQVLIAGRPIGVTLTTEPDDQDEEIIVTVSFNGQYIR